MVLRSLSQHGWVRGSGPAVLGRLQDAAVVRPGFLSAAEEETLSRELEPELRRRRYEYDHWDAVRRVALGRVALGLSHRGVAWDVKDPAVVERWGGRGFIWAGPGNGGEDLILGVLGAGRALWRCEQGHNEAEPRGVWGTGLKLGVEMGVERDEGGSRVEGWRQGTR